MCLLNLESPTTSAFRDSTVATIVPVNIPLNFQSLAEELLKLPVIVENEEEVEKYGSDPDIEMELTYEASGNGYTLFYIGYFDYWAIHTPNGRWLRAAIGYDDAFIQKVLEPKNYVEAFRANINSLKEVLPVFVLRQFS